MRRLLFGLSLAITAISFAAVASADENDPEVTDPSGDTVDELTNAPVDRPALDLRKVWFSQAASTFSVHLTVEDLPPANGGRTWQWWVYVDIDGITHYAVLQRSDNTAVDVSSFGPVGSTEPATTTEDGTVVFDAATDSMVLTMPRTYSLGSTSWTFGPGTVFENGRAASFESAQGTGVGAVFAKYDTTAPGDDYTFGAPASPNNRRLDITPVLPVVGVAADRATAVAFNAVSDHDVEITETLTATVPAGWILDRTTLETAPGTATFNVRPPASAPNGTTAVLRVTGGRDPAETLLVVGDAIAQKVDAAAPAAPTTTAGSELLRFYLQGATVANVTGADTRPVFPGNLIEAAPTGGSPDVVSTTVAAGSRAGLGVWRTEPLDAPAILRGLATLTVHMDGAPSAQVRALVGRDPLPLDLSGNGAPAGTFLLAPQGSSATTGIAQFVAVGDVTGLRLAPGERLAVALFVDNPTSASLSPTLRLFTADSPSRLEFNVSKPTASPLTPAFAPGAPTAIFAASEAAAFGVGSSAIDAELIGPDGREVPLVAIREPVKLRHGAPGRSAQVNTTTVSYQRTTTGEVGRLEFYVEPDAQALVVELAGPTGINRFRDHDVDLELYRVEGGATTFVKASRGYSAQERVIVSPQELDQLGRGAYRAIARHNAYAQGDLSASASATLRSTQSFFSETPAGAYETRLLWALDGLDRGTYTLRSGLAETKYFLGAMGPTLPPVAIATPPQPARAGTEMLFRDASTDLDGRIVSWLWEFADGTNSTQQNATKAFARPGAYLVKLTVTDDLGANATTSFTVTVLPRLAVPKFSYEPTDPVVGKAIQFKDLTEDLDGVASVRFWSFGDGETSEAAEPTKVYERAGSYVVGLRVGESFAKLGNPFELTVTVRDAVGNATPPASLLIAAISAPGEAEVGQPVRFVDASTGLVASRTWDFGDGSTSAELDPLHRFVKAGTYNVTLTIANATARDVGTHTIRVVTPVTSAVMLIQPEAPLVGTPVVFVDATIGADASWRRTWTFGDGASAEGLRVEHGYASAGDKSVTLRVHVPGGDVLATTRTITIREPGAPVNDAILPIARYKADYEAGRAHDERYPESTMSSELAGTLFSGREYLSPRGGSPIYLAGNALRSSMVDRELQLLSGARAIFAEATVTLGPLSASIHDIRSFEIDGRLVDVPVAMRVPPPLDSLDDGISLWSATGTMSGVAITHSTSYLDGTLHIDARRELSAPGQSLALPTLTTLSAPAGSWVALPRADGGIDVIPIAEATGRALVLGKNTWVAVFQTGAPEVVGVVLSGDVIRANLTYVSATGELLVAADHVATGSLLAAHYLVAYAVGDLDATRYAGVMELARQDAEELGVVVLDEGRAVGVGWAGSRARIDASVRGGVGTFWDSLMGTPASWSLAVEAPSSQGGKRLRVVLPASVAIEGGFEVYLDGAPVGAGTISAQRDDRTLILTIPIDHFSLRSLEIKAVVPGVSPIWMWATVALGAVFGVAGTAYGVRELRSRAATRGMGDELPPPAQGLGATAQSAAVRRALAGGARRETPADLPRKGATPGPATSTTVRRTLQGIADEAASVEDEETPSQYRSALLRKLQAEAKPLPAGFRRCPHCSAPTSTPMGTACRDCGKL